MSNKVDLAIAKAGEAVERVMNKHTRGPWRVITDSLSFADGVDIRAVCVLRGHDAGHRDAKRKMAEITEILDKAGAL